MRRTGFLLIFFWCFVLPAAAQEAPSTTTQEQLDINSLGLVAPEFFVRAVQAADSGDHQRAILDYTTFILLNPTNAAAYAERGLSYMELKQLDAALQDYDTALAMGFSQPDQTALVYLRLADIHLQQQNAEAALSDLNAAIATAPSAGAYYLRGTLYQTLERQDDAQQDFDKALELDPNYSPALEGGLDLARTQNDPQAVVDAATKLLQSDPTSIEGYFRRGVAYAQNGDLQASLADFSKVIELAPDDPSAYFNRAIIEQSLGDDSAALNDLNKVIEMSPSDPSAYYLRGQIYVGQQKLTEARADFTRVIELAPRARPEVFLYRGFVNNLLEDIPAAAADYTQWATAIQTQGFNQEKLVSGNSTDVQMAEGRVYRIPFDGKTGQVLNVRANNTTGAVDPILIILDPDGTPLIANDDVGGGYNAAIIDFALPVDGVYTIVVSHARGGSDGPVRVNLLLSNPNP